MTDLTWEHEQLAQQQQSSILLWFGKLPLERKITAIAFTLIVGVLAGAKAYTGTISDRIFFCLKTPQKQLICQDKNNREFRMTVWHWNRWGEDGRSLHAIPNPHKGRNGIVKASNPHKPLWSLMAFCAFSTAGWMFRCLQDNERKFSSLEYLQEKKQLALAELKVQLELLDQYRELVIKQVQLQGDIDLIASDRALDIQKAEIIGETEIKITQMEAADTLFEAETAGLSQEEQQEYLNFLRQHQTPYLQGSQTLQGTVAPGDKVEGTESLRVEGFLENEPSTITSSEGREIFNPWDYANENQIPQEYRWLKEFICNTALVVGSQGSGKSWFVRLLALLKKLKGYRVIIFDPNSNKGEWLGVEFYGSYEEIRGQMQWYVDEIQHRYDQFRNSTMTEAQWRSHLWRNGKAITIICEEYSTYSDFIDDKQLLKRFVKSASTLCRKQEAPVTFVTHNLSKECLGSVEGVFDIFKRMQRISLDTATDPQTDQPVSAGTANIKGVDADNLRPVKTPKLENKITDFRTERQKIDDARRQLQLYEELEGIIPKSNNDVANSSTSRRGEQESPHLSAIALIILQIIKSASKLPINFEAIRKSRKWKQQPEKKALLAALAELILSQKIVGDEESGYIPFE